MVKFTQQTISASIHSLSHDGRGVAKVEGKTTFISGALPDETVLFEYTRRHSRFDEGKATDILTASSDRVVPKCTHFAICGGCSLQHLHPQAQLEAKQAILLEHLQHIGHVQPSTILAPLVGTDWGYRHKARLSVRFVNKKNRLLLGFREKHQSRFVADMNTCEILHPSAGQRISALKTLVGQLDACRDIAQVEVAVGDQATAFVFRHLTALSDADQAKLITFAQTEQVWVYLQPGGANSIHRLWPQTDPELLSYHLPEYQLELQFAPTDFTQIHANLNRKMLTQAIHLLELNQEDIVLDLFCGLGNFSLALARHCQQVVAVEGDEQMVQRGQHNAILNGIINVEFYQADLNQNISNTPWMQQPITKVLLDPPRCGAMAIIQQLKITPVKRIVYISCNPTTLARDADELVHQQGYHLLKAGVINMFPHTSHIESMAVFEK